MKIWVTKYALSKGIIEGEATICPWDSHMAGICRDGGVTEYFDGNEWHKTYVAARRRAKDMVALKLRVLDKKMQQLEKLKF